MKVKDKNYWHIFGLGEYGIITSKIFHNYKKYNVDEYGSFEELECDDELFGMDFGSANPTSMVHLKRWEENVYDEELDIWKDIPIEREF